MRAFIAVELPENIIKIVSEFQNLLRKSGADVKWVQPQNLHLTLRFLGEIGEEMPPRLAILMQETVGDKETFVADLSELGVFPSLNSPRVVWAGINAGAPQIKIIADILEEKICLLGFQRETQTFSPHITLGRVKSSFNRIGLVEAIRDLSVDFAARHLQFNVNRISLFQSKLTPRGPIYQKLKDISLKTT